MFELVKQCAPNIAPETMLAIIKTESNNNFLVINDNTLKKAHFPKTKEEAINLSYVLIKKGHNLDFGLTQINLANAKKYKLTLNNIFNPCINIKYGAKIITDAYFLALKTTNDEQMTLLKALSTYNTGSQEKGFINGYVLKVIKNTPIFITEKKSFISE